MQPTTCEAAKKTRPDKPQKPASASAYCHEGSAPRPTKPQARSAGTGEASRAIPQLRCAARSGFGDRGDAGRRAKRLRRVAPRFGELGERRLDLSVELVELANQLVVARVEPGHKFARLAR